MKTYLCIIVSAVTMTSAHAQITGYSNPAQLEEFQATIQPNKPTNQAASKTVVWNETFGLGTTSPTTTLGPTFSTANGTWTTDGVNGDIWKHSFFTASGEWSGGTAPMASMTETDGKMLFDADSVNTPLSPNYQTLTGSLISPPIDLTTHTSAILNWQQNSRYCCTAPNGIQVSISTDNGLTWGTPMDASVGLIYPNVDFHSVNGFSYDASINITPEAAGNTILLKFTWDGNGNGNTHHYWEMDDVSISTLPDHDLRIVRSWIIGENNQGIQYASTPVFHLDDNYYVGSSIHNAGALDQTNLYLTSDYSSFNSNSSQGLLEVDSITKLQSLVNSSVLTSTGTYTGLYTIVSDDETSSGSNFGNNTETTIVEVSNYNYSIDGIDVYSNPIVTSIGSSSFVGGEDGLVLANKYTFYQEDYVCALQIMLDSNTVTGSQVQGVLMDTTTFLANDMTPIHSTNLANVSIADSIQGYVFASFGFATSLPAGTYYVGAILTSNGNNNEIGILDDLTVDQPWDASMIYIPGDQIYYNGNAFGIRIHTDWCWMDIQENSLAGISIYPNPSDGVVTITNDNFTENTIVVYDLAGKVILTKETSEATTIDLTNQGAGVYIVEVANNLGMMTERIVIQ
ncbi:MAG: T9SS type A sorting domain-containing protein [Crocinitomicaceae bacterium]|nr:T9SS type A sorting domain-containing protein [Crocinitomicaceae bacterium]